MKNGIRDILNRLQLIRTFSTSSFKACVSSLLNRLALLFLGEDLQTSILGPSRSNMIRKKTVLPIALLVLLALGVGTLEGSSDVLQSSQKPTSTPPGHPPASDTKPAEIGRGPPGGVDIDHNKSDVESRMKNKAFSILVNGNGQIPFYHWNASGDAGRFHVHIIGLVEYVDGNGDLSFQQNESVKRLSLQGGAKWNLSDFASTDDYIVFSFYTSQIKQTGFEGLTINLTNWLFKDSTSLKFDIAINGWPWENTSSRLGFEFRLSWIGAKTPDKAQSFNSNATHKGVEDNSTVPTGILSGDIAGLSIPDDQGGILGFFSASESAQGEIGSDLSVVSQILKHNNRTALYILNYPYFGSFLQHDPTLGVGSAGSFPASTIGTLSVLISNPGLFAVTAAVSVLGAGLYILNRRRR